MKLSAIDANLLVALDVLLEEAHVTRSASRLGVTQSAMSQTLQRLRDLLGDPLLTRSGRGMVLTPRARAMTGPLREALRALHLAVTDAPSFDPANDVRAFRVACLDTYAASILPRLAARLVDAGESLSLDFVSLDVEHIWDDLRGGDLDVALIGPWNPPADIRCKRLVEEHMVSMVRAGHPILDDVIDAEAFCRYPHANFLLTGRGANSIDERLASLGLERRVVARSPYFLAAPSLALSGDLIVTVPRSAAKVFADHWPVALFETPVGPTLKYTLSLAWPSFLGAEPANVWLRQQLLELGQTLCGEAAACAVTACDPMTCESPQPPL